MMANHFFWRSHQGRVVGDLIKVVLTNYSEGPVEALDASYYPHDVPLTGSRNVPFSRELWIEREDFMKDPRRKFFRLAPAAKCVSAWGSSSRW